MSDSQKTALLRAAVNDSKWASEDRLDWDIQQHLVDTGDLSPDLFLNT